MTSIGLKLRLLGLGVLAALVLPALTRAEESKEPPLADIALSPDKSDRMAVTVRVGSTGPWRFIVDTGADRSVISTEIARALSLKPGRLVTIHTMNGTDRVQVMDLPVLDLGGVLVSGLSVPALEARNIGGDGVVGIDSLKDKRLTIDFRSQTMTVEASSAPEPPREPNEIVVTARSRFGQLILVDADAYDQRLQVVLDTGAENSVGNEALRSLVRRKQVLHPPVKISLVGVTGNETPADFTWIERMRVGGFNVTNAPIAFADAHPFRRFGLTGRPAMLMGMDLLRKFDRVQIDFAKRKIRFLLPRIPKR